VAICDASFFLNNTRSDHTEHNIKCRSSAMWKLLSNQCNHLTRAML